MALTGIDHVQLPIPAGGEEAAREFYGAVLGLPEVPKPGTLAGRGGVWFQVGAQQLHCGVESNLPATRRHPAFVCDDLGEVRATLEGRGLPVRHEPEIPGYRRIFTEDPFGNRLELMERLSG